MKVANCLAHLHGGQRLEEKLRNGRASCEGDEKHDGEGRIDSGRLDYHCSQGGVVRTVTFSHDTANAVSIDQQSPRDKNGNDDVKG